MKLLPQTTKKKLSKIYKEIIFSLGTFSLYTSLILKPIYYLKSKLLF